MSSSNILVSNGTCYSAAGQKLDGSFIPCGNAAFGHQTCCGAGDNCLGDHACFGIHGSAGYGSYLTYMAGCTDPDYKDGSCPDKKGIDQPWIALTVCNNTDDHVWAACSQEGNPTTLQPGSFCSCSDAASATVAFTDTNSPLPNTASLPQSTGQSIQYFAGYVPTAPGVTVTAAPPSAPTSAAQPGSGSGSSTGGSVTQPSASQTRTSGPSQSESSAGNSDNAGGTTSGLSSGAKAGIGVGVGVAVLVFLAVMVALLLSHRRKKRQRSTSEVGSGKRPHGRPDSANVSEADGQAVSETDGQPARPWSMRSELEGSHPPPLMSKPGIEGGAVADEKLSPVAELPGSEVERWQDLSDSGGKVEGGQKPLAQGEGTRVMIGNEVVYL
ncbi:hypothetical protein B0T17DRAFT_540696 [Bombardia bombarda]|uniref:Uncharacterized protein n=1 Tax=Bombardia bombarda TaxID=252184 RepID=A0AA39WGG2_9PEZI|nr:hypothetical protein B0T17DRAFT_540696 [Bombardia bombarda]